MGAWHRLASACDDAALELVDYALPHLDEPVPALYGRYTPPHARQWAERIASFDSFQFVTPEYDQSIRVC